MALTQAELEMTTVKTKLSDVEHAKAATTSTEQERLKQSCQRIADLEAAVAVKVTNSTTRAGKFHSCDMSNLPPGSDFGG